MKRSWSPAAEEKLRQLYATTPLPRLAFLLKRTEKAIVSRAKILGLRRSSRRRWTPAEDRAVCRRFPKEPAHVIARDLGRGVSAVYQRAHQLGAEKPAEWAAECTHKRWAEGRHENSRKRQFKKGEPSWSKGTKGRVGVQPGCRATQFRKGRPTSESRNYVPIGSLRISRDGYLERKVTDDPNLKPVRRWVGVHRLVWIAAHGPIPADKVVCFLPGRSTTDEAAITVDALELVTRPELMKRNTLHRYPKPVAKLIQLRGALNRKINARTKQA